MSKIVPLTQDEKSRDAIIHKIDTNLFVEAGAGSGKTTMLVNRMVAMIESGVPVDKICAITFTKNAALEFYERFAQKLIERSNPNNKLEPKRAGDLDEPTDITRLRCAKALEDIDLCFMGTIDSFCNMILSEHPSEANIPSDACLIDEAQAKEIYAKYYIDARNGNYGKDIQQYAKRFAMLFWNDEEAFYNMMNEIMDRRNIEFVVKDDLCQDFFKTFNKVRDDVKKVLDKFNEDKSKITLSLSKNDDRDMMSVYDNANETLQKGWHYNYSGVLKAIKDISSLTYDASVEELGFSSESIVRAQDDKTILNVKDEDNKDALLYKLINYKYQNALKFVLMSVSSVEELMRKQGKFTFFDYLYYLRNTLVNDANKEGKLIEYIYNRHSYYLIDEFQDTNPLQAEIFFYLTAQNPCVSDWRDCKPKPGSLFIVGDPKQSIYRFRAADVSSYLKIKDLFIDNKIGEVKYLVNNFRSKNVVKQYFNDVFEEVMPNQEEEQSKYVDIENTNVEEEKEFDGIYTYESYSDSLLGEYPEMSDNLRLAKLVKTLVDNPKCLIKGEDKKLRTITYKDIMIIFSGKKHIAPCIDTFNQLHIPSRVEGKVLFEKCEGLKAIYNIYQTITDINNNISLVSTLCGQVFGLSENDLTAYRKLGKQIKIDFNEEYGDSNIEKAFNRLSTSAKEALLLTPSSLYEKIIDDYQIFKYVSSENLEIVYYVLELIRAGANSGTIITHKDALDFVSDLLSGDTEIERCLSLKANINAVHIANLHKVKGLEAPVVILARAGVGNNSPNIRVEYNKDCAKGYIMSLQEKGDDDISYSLIETNQNKDKVDQEKISLAKEDDRLVYVAATRARNVLIINEAKQRGRGDKPQASRNKWKALKERANLDIFEVLGDNNSYKEIVYEKVDAEDLYDNKLISIGKQETYSYKKPSEIQVATKLVDSNYEDDAVNKDETYATLIGTMVHKLLEVIITSKDRVKKDILIDSILNEYVTLEYAMHTRTFKEKLNKVFDVMHNGGFVQKYGAPQDIIHYLLNADEVSCEVPFTYLKDNSIVNGVVDLIYRKDNKLYIIDWKTNKNDIDLDKHYAEQLNIYKSACEKMLNEKIESALIYHVDIS